MSKEKVTSNNVFLGVSIIILAALIVFAGTSINKVPALELDMLSIEEDLEKLDIRVTTMESELMGAMASDIAALKAEVNGIKNNVKETKDMVRQIFNHLLAKENR